MYLIIFLSTLAIYVETTSIIAKPPLCSPNEHYEKESVTCQITCENMHLEHIMGACFPNSTCYCDNGYVRNDLGVCIKREQCPQPQCDVNEEYSVCGPGCEETCENRGDNCTVCTEPDREGCFCKQGLVRADDGSCVEPSCCPERTCEGPNEEFVLCPPTCPGEACSVLWSRIDCRNASKCCKPQCRCKSGYYRKGEVCVPGKECSSNPVNECGENAHYNKCGTACPLTCEEPLPRPCTKQCNPGCECDDGFIKDCDGNCIKPDKCPPPVNCDKDEYFSTCGTACPPTCDDPNPKACTKNCVRGCFCVDGLVKDTKSGKCIPLEKCPPPKCNDDEEYQKCGTACEETCENSGDTCRACTQQCVEGCFCKAGLVRAADGSCISPKKCPPRVCNGPNEEFQWCPPNCPHQNCSAIWSRIDCTNASTCCKPQCRCKDGFYRNDSDICISTDECINEPNICPPNSHFNRCGTACPLTCDEPLPRACTKQCNPGCECDDGFIKDCDGNCIKPDKCPKPLCGKNETYVFCNAQCPTDYCKESNNPDPACSPPHPCPPGCRCKKDYKKSNVNGKCILASECPPPVICGNDEYFSNCGTACPPTCDNPKPEICTDNCVSGCFCKSNLVRDTKSGKCIPFKSCPPKVVCDGPNEEITECYTPCVKTCKTRIRGDGKICHTACIEKGCVCKEGTLRHDNGTCVPIAECSPPKCNDDEEYQKCGTACEETCENTGDTCRACTQQCVEGCFCKAGLVRAADGSCISPKKCPIKICNGPNEEFQWCPPNCPHQNCSAIWSRIDCRNALTCCKPQCRCIDGYYRNDSGVCISTEECINGPNTCPKNSHFSKCGTPCPLTCDVPLPRPCPRKLCIPGCDCDEGYVKDENGNCVKPEQCPPKKCKENEDYQSCGTACEETCDNRGDTCMACTQQCVPGCFCKKGLVRAKDGLCVEPKSCPEPVCKGPNEEFQWCPPNCPHQNCSAIWSKFDCSNASKCCKPQCRCIDGYYRNDSGICISVEECINGPNICPKNSHFNKCGTTCPLTCDEPLPRPCTKQCVSGCQCDDGLLKDQDGNCIKPEECPKPLCPKNETYVQCKFGCPTDYCKESNLPDPQCLPPNPCLPGCRCKPGYKKRRGDGECIKASDCPPPVICGKNEHYESCGTACPKTCKLPDPKACTANCVPGCFCNGDLVRNKDTGECIPLDKCPTKECTGEHEVYTDCGSACPKTCRNMNETGVACPQVCVAGCFCENDYVRNDAGKCVKPENCDKPPKKCKENEEYQSCGTACEETCDNRGDTCTACTKQCVSGCFCKKGLVRAKDGSCVEPKCCPEPVCNGPNEEFKWCPPNCPHQNCSVIWSSFDCTNASKCCKPQCRCTDGHFRNESGICVSIDECLNGPKTCPKNSQFNKCGTACPLTCDEPLPRPCTRQCVAGCQCDNGFVKDKDGNCINPDECPTKKCTGDNEVYTDCGTACPKTCRNMNETGVACTLQCVSGCFCEEGYVRNDAGKCVKPEDCDEPKTCGANEEYKTCGTCQPTCKVGLELISCIAGCIPGCFCKKGFIRKDVNGPCIPTSECPPKEICPINEHYEKCGSACPKTCDQQKLQVCTLNCVPGCVCNDGLVRNKKNDQCIPPEKCPGKQCTGENEIYTDCGTACPTTCSNMNETGRVCTLQCVQGCFCVKGYVRNDAGKCVKPEDCDSTPKCPVNEEWNSCGTACPKTCKNKDLKLSCIAVCKEGCFCKNGLVRNDKGICVSPTECPIPTCPDNEEWNTCGTACPKTCRNKNLTLPCTANCVEGCFCKKGLVRNDDGVCILPSKCPPPECPKNEEWNSCGTACPKTCKNKDLKIRCIDLCVEGCFCKDGLVRNDEGICIPPKKCPIACGKNEVYNESRIICPPQTCASIYTTYDCSNVTTCEPGCDCIDGYLRNGTMNDPCIPSDECPPPIPTCPTNEEYDSCGTACPKTCKNKDKNIICTDDCVEGCFCKKGLVRNNDGDCIKPSKCPAKVCPKNEEWKSCGTACPQSCKTLNKSIYCPQVCKKGCFCIKGLVRGPNGKCISPNKCPKPFPPKPKEKCDES